MGNPYAPPGEKPGDKPGDQQADRPDEKHGAEPGQALGDNQAPQRPPAQGGAGQGAPGGAHHGPHHPGAPDHGGPHPGGSDRDGSSPQWPDRPERPEPGSEIARATSRRVLHFLSFLLAAVLTSALPLPWQAGAIVFVLAAIAVGIRTLVLAWRGGVRGGLVVMLGVGVGMAAFVGLGMLSLLALWPQQLERQECLARAVTISATRTCEVEFQRAVEDRLGGLGTAPGGS